MNVATVFSGIGAIEHAPLRMGLAPVIRVMWIYSAKKFRSM